jgi:hypothetical protein
MTCGSKEREGVVDVVDVEPYWTGRLAVLYKLRLFSGAVDKVAKSRAWEEVYSARVWE